jgi:CRP/FNR family transcriptional regulator
MFSHCSADVSTAIHVRTGLGVFRAGDNAADPSVGRSVAEALRLLHRELEPPRRIVHAGDPIYRAGDRFVNLYVLNSGSCKVINSSTDGREQLVGLSLRGDWLGFDGIAGNRYACDAIAMDTAEIWEIRYDALLAACASERRLMGVLHDAMSREITRDRDSLMSVCTLPADARVADFLRNWCDSLARSGLRTDQIRLRLTRAEIGNHLGMNLETVSRALSRLTREKLIAFADKGRREVSIPDAAALAAFVQRHLPIDPLLQ